MTETIWQKEECSPGRRYMLGKDPYIKYEDTETIISSIVEGLRHFIHAEPAVRLTLDSAKSDSERTILAIPFETDLQIILRNVAKLLFESFMGYYFSGNPQTSHFGIANMLLEGNHNSLLKREVEKLIFQLQNRADIAGRVLQNVTFVGKQPVPKAGDVFLAETIKKGLDIHIGYRINAIGESVNCSQIFLPIQAGSELIELIYHNIERILHRNFVVYDETSQGYLKISDTLIFKELVELLKRAKSKELTRNKILNNLQFDSVTKRETEEEKKLLIGDRLYDMLNHIQDTKLREATDRSRDLYTSLLNATVGMPQQQLRPAAERVGIPAAGPTPTATDDSGTGTPAATAAPGTAAPATAEGSRPIRRRAPAPSDGSRRRRFQKVDLTQDEIESAKVQVPEPLEESRRVPSPRKRRITRIRPEEVGVPSKKE